LLHLADCMQNSGPLWASWAFPMERFCGKVQRTITGRLNPYPGIDWCILQCCQWEILHPKFLRQLRGMRGNMKEIREGEENEEEEEEEEEDEEGKLLPPKTVLMINRALCDKLVPYLASQLNVAHPTI
ncbi:hypothetical protein DACRYDRAFT_51660, partial [Dacryopinax primogenitus]